MVRAIKGKLKDIEKLYTIASEAVLNIVLQMYKALIQVELQSAPIIIDMNKEMLASILDDTKIFSQLFSVGRSSLWAMILKAALDWWIAFKEALEEVELPEILELIILFFEDMIALFVEQIDNWKNLGGALMSGLAAGLRAGAAGVYAVAQQIANNVQDIVESAMETDSPSKVFMDIGTNMMDGWRIGLEGGQSALYGSLASIADGIADMQAGQQARVPASVQHRSAAPSVVAQAGVVNHNSIELGGQTFGDPFSQQQMQILVEQALRKVVG